MSLVEVETNSFETLWNKLVLRKVCVFSWRLAHGRLPVRKVLDDMGIDIHSLLCPCCNNVVESIEHCFVWCDKARVIWEKIFRWWRLGQLNVGSIRELLSHNGLIGFSCCKKLIWQDVIWSALYIIWTHRNSIVFKPGVAVVPDLFGEIQVRSFEWISARIKKKVIMWVDWKKSPVAV